MKRIKRNVIPFLLCMVFTTLIFMFELPFHIALINAILCNVLIIVATVFGGKSKWLDILFWIIICFSYSLGETYLSKDLSDINNGVPVFIGLYLANEIRKRRLIRKPN